MKRTWRGGGAPASHAMARHGLCGSPSLGAPGHGSARLGPARQSTARGERETPLPTFRKEADDDRWVEVD